MTSLKIFFYRIKTRLNCFFKGECKAVFLDRDGTLNVDWGYISSTEKINLFPETTPALKKLLEMGFLLIIVSNQSGVGRGFFSLKTAKKVMRFFEEILAKEKIYFAGIYLCPHAPQENCRCRKPSPYFFEKAKKKFHLNEKKCYAIGDKLSDVEAAGKAGIKGFLLGKDCKNIADAVGLIKKEIATEK